MNTTIKIQESLTTIFRIANIVSKQDLDEWCGDRARERLYSKVQLLSPENWERVRNPKENVRFRYQKILTGYKINSN